MQLLIRIIVVAITLLALDYLLPGVTIDGFVAAVVAAIVLGLLQLFVKPLLVILTIPLTIMTLGLFMFVINASIILLAAYFVTGFSVDGFFNALIVSLSLSVAQSLLHE